MEDLLNKSNKQLTELTNQTEQVRKERLKQEKKNIIKDLRNIILKAEERNTLFAKENPSYLPIYLLSTILLIFMIIVMKLYI